MEKWRDGEMQNKRTAKRGKKNREIGRAPLTDQIRGRHAPGCGLRVVVGLVASCYIDPNGHVGCGGGVVSSISSPEGGGGGPGPGLTRNNSCSQQSAVVRKVVEQRRR